MVFNKYLDKKTGAIITIAIAFLVIAQFSGMFSTVAKAETGTVISYCGSPEWFDQFSDQEGYNPNARCTGVQVMDYRIDVSKDDWKNGGYGCYADYTVYKIQNNGDLKQVATGNGEKEIKLDGLTVEKTSSNMNFYECEYIGTEYEIEIPGNVSWSNTVSQDKIVEGETVDIQVKVSNNYGYNVKGDLVTNICAKSGFGKKVCTKRTESVSLNSNSKRVFDYSVSTSDLRSGDLKVSTSFDGTLKGVTNSWQGVNLDCDGDGVIEPVDKCSGFNIQGSGESASVKIVRASPRNSVEIWFNRVENVVVALLSDLTRGGGPS